MGIVTWWLPSGSFTGRRRPTAPRFRSLRRIWLKSSEFKGSAAKPTMVLKWTLNLSWKLSASSSFRFSLTSESNRSHRRNDEQRTAGIYAAAAPPSRHSFLKRQQASAKPPHLWLGGLRSYFKVRLCRPNTIASAVTSIAWKNCWPPSN